MEKHSNVDASTVYCSHNFWTNMVTLRFYNHGTHVYEECVGIQYRKGTFLLLKL